jgi:hypothetical protein
MFYDMSLLSSKLDPKEREDKSHMHHEPKEKRMGTGKCAWSHGTWVIGGRQPLLAT